MSSIPAYTCALVLGLALAQAPPLQAHTVAVTFEDPFGVTGDTEAHSVTSPVVVSGVGLDCVSGFVTSRGKDSSTIPFVSDWIEFALTASFTFEGSPGPGSVRVGGIGIPGGSQISVTVTPPGIALFPVNIMIPTGPNVVDVPFQLTSAGVVTVTLGWNTTEMPKIGIDDLIREFDNATGVEQDEAGSTAVRLLQNSPNPFTAATSIAYELAQGGRVRLSVYDLSGRCVRLLEDAVRREGRHVAIWDGRDTGGVRVGGGVYFCRLDVNGHELSRRILRLR